jgi:hypothetical protein
MLHKKIFEKKNNEVGKNKFYKRTKKNKSKNQVGKSDSQMLLSISFVCVICFTNRFRK